jgi:hypothetical protein
MAYDASAWTLMNNVDTNMVYITMIIRAYDEILPFTYRANIIMIPTSKKCAHSLYILLVDCELSMYILRLHKYSQ